MNNRGNIIAERILQGKNQVQIRISVQSPIMVDTDQWQCNFSVEGVLIEEPHFVFGVDSLQALMLALERIAFLLEAYDDDLKWQFAEPGDLGLYRYITPHLGINFANEMRKYMKNKEDEFVEKLKVRAKANHDENP